MEPASRRLNLLLALLTTLVLPATAIGQPDTAGDPLPRSPMEEIFEQRAALNLSPDQLMRLDGIRGQLASDNEPLVNEMMTLRTEWQQARRAVRNGRGPQAEARVERIRETAERTRARIQQNNRKAMQSVNRLLRPPQREQLRRIVQERRQQNPERRAGAGSRASDTR